MEGVLATMEERRRQWDRTKQEYDARAAQGDEQMPQQGFINRQTWDVEYDVERSMILKPMHASTHDDARQVCDDDDDDLSSFVCFRQSDLSLSLSHWRCVALH